MLNLSPYENKLSKKYLYESLNKNKNNILKSNTFWNYLKVADILLELDYREQALGYYIIALKKSNQDFILEILNQYISKPKDFINLVSKKVEKKSDLKTILYNLWGGYSFQSLIWLEYIFINEEINEEIKFEAGWNIARWYHYKKDFSKVFDKIEHIEKHFYNDFTKRKEFILLNFYYLVDSNKIDSAKEYIEKELLHFKDDNDLTLAYASINNDEVIKLSLINNVFIKNNLLQIKKTNLENELSFKNIESIKSKKIIDKHLVSVIVPVYNAENTIEIAIKSLINQTWNNLEIIIVDDCSTDLTIKIIEKITKEHSNVKLLSHKSNQGAYVARNNGLNIASGYYITTHDSDDWSHPQKIETQINYLNANIDKKAVCTHWIRTSFKLNFIYNWRVGKELIHWSHSSLLFKKDIIKDIGFWDDVRVGADTEFIWRIQRKYGKESVEKIYPEIPFSFALDNDTNLTRSKATHIQSMYYGLRYIYRENAKNWHQENKDLKLNRKSRLFKVPCALMDKNKYFQTFDKIYVADFTDTLLIKKIKNTILNHSNLEISIGIFHWPNFASPEALDKEYFKLLSIENVKLIVSGYDVEVKELFLFDKNHQLIIPEYFPIIRAQNVNYFLLSQKIVNNQSEVYSKLQEAFNTNIININSYKIKQLNITTNKDEIFINENINVIGDKFLNINQSIFEEIYFLTLNCKLSSLNFFDDNALKYLEKKIKIDNCHYSAINLTYSLMSIYEKDHLNSKITRNILLHLSKNDTFLLFIFITKIPDKVFPFISKFYFLLLLKKKIESNFMQYIALRISNFSENSLSELIDIHSITDLVNRGVFQKNNFYLSIENTKTIHYNAQEMIKNILKFNVKKNNLNLKKSIKKVFFVIARPFFDNISTNSHFIVLDVYSKLINHYNKINPNSIIEKNILITSEKTFNLPVSDSFISDQNTIKINLELFLKNKIIDTKDNFFIDNFENNFDKLNSFYNLENKLSYVEPDLLIFLGGTFDSKIFRYITFNKYPISFLPTTSSLNNAYGMPDYFFDTTKAATLEHKNDLIQWGIDENKIFYFHKPFFIDKELLSKNKFSWESYLLNKPKGNLILTPLTGNRINKWISEMDITEINLFINLFSEVQDLIWIFVGQSFESFYKLSKNKNKKIIELLKNKKIIIIEYTSELNELLQEINLVFFPSNGGATTIANAIYYEKPCVIPLESDASALVSNKSLFTTRADSFSKIKDIINDNELKKEIILESKKSLDDRSNIQEISKNFIEQLFESIELYKKRI